MWHDGREILRQTHKDHVSKFCDHAKYVDQSTSCSNQDITTMWETNGTQMYALNQKCYGEAGRFLNWKYFVMFLLVGFMVLFLAVLALMNLNMLRDPEADKTNVSFLAVLGIMALIALALGLYLIFGYGAPEHSLYSHWQTNFNKKFKPVSKTVSATAPASSTFCNSYSSVKPFQLNGNKDQYGRLAILTQNSRIDGLKNDLGASQRLHFFNDLNSNNNFYIMKGTQDELNKALSRSQICINGTQTDAYAYFKYETAEADQLDKDALREGENPNSPFLQSKGAEFDGSGVTHANQCAETCFVGSDLSSNSKRLFTIPLIVQNKDGSSGIYTLPETGLRARVLDKNHSHLGYAMITQKSQVAFEMNTYPGVSYPVLI